MATTVGRVLFTRFMMWLAIAVVGSYFLFSIDTKPIKEHGFSVTTLIKSVSIPRLKLGTDLQGGTYLVLGVEVEKAVESRLASESKSLTDKFEKKNLSVRPSKMEISNLSILMECSDDNVAKIVYNFVRKEMPSLNAVVNNSLVTAVLSPIEEQRIRTGSVEQGVSVLDNRLNNFGVSGLIVQRHGDRQIVVQLPGVDDPERVKSVITKTAHLEFKIVKKYSANREALLDDFDGELPSDMQLVPGQKKNDYDEAAGMWYLVSVIPDLGGEHIVDARMDHDEYGKIRVAFQLDSSGAQIFREVTGSNVGRQLGIVIDNVMYSAPVINGVIGSNGTIQGNYTVEEARDLALVLRSGSLQAPITFEQESRVGASLGQDSIFRGILSCLIGLALLFFFSLFYYKVPGLFAMAALFYNLFAILLFLSYFEATLTLPGIAGMVLTIGMAIDASVLIYERIKELLAEGAPLRKAVNEGFNGAMVVILDSNITTFLTGLILFKFGGPAIKGFAITLMAGIIATIIAGVYFLKALFDFTIDHVSSKLIKF